MELRVVDASREPTPRRSDTPAPVPAQGSATHGQPHAEQQHPECVPHPIIDATNPETEMSYRPSAGEDMPAGGISPESIAALFERRQPAALAALGGTEALCAHFSSHPTRGLPPDLVDPHRAQYGVNELPPAERVTFIGLFIDAMSDRILIMLLIAAIVSIVLGLTVAPSRNCNQPANVSSTRPDYEEGWVEGTAILISVLVVSLVSTVNNYRKARKFEELDALASRQAVDVVRNGEVVGVDQSEVVCGDILVCSYGQIVCADALYLSGADFKTEESAVTGESDLKRKDPVRNPFLISGSSVETGECLALVVAVGEQSFNGIQMMKTREPPRLTPLQEKLEDLAETIGKAGMAAALVTLVVLVVVEIVYIFAVPSYCNYYHSSSSSSPVYARFVDFIIIAIAIIVVAIPEGLPLAVTIALAYSMNRMMDDQCQVRHLAACETMGAATAICSDKTGTLTTNEMTVVQAWVAGGVYYASDRGVASLHPVLYPSGDGGDGGVPNATVIADAVAAGVARDVFVGAVVANSKSRWARFETIKTTVAGEQLTVVEERWAGGNKTEEALLRAVLPLRGWTPQALCDARAAMGTVDRKVYPFNSDKKRQTVLLRGAPAASTHARADEVRVFVQGASEVVLRACTHRLGRDGDETCPLTDADRAGLERIITAMAGESNRTICIATSRVPARSAPWAAAALGDGGWPEDEPDVDAELCVVAVVGIQDPIRPEVPGAIAKCQRAGITVRMVTGDNIDTARAIARRCGIMTDAHEAMEGSAFRRMAADEPDRLKALLPRLRVLARSSPTDKYVLAELLIRAGDVVAMTGDGTNDAPALKLAHVGFAMNVGTAIAKAASDIVILDNNFASVVKACMWGRNVNDAVKKFLQFQLTINIVGVLITFVSAVGSSERESLLRPVQLLWLNLIMDTFAALALATEGPTEALLEREPVYRQAPLVSRRMWTFIAVHGAYQLAVQLILVFWAYDWGFLCTDEYVLEGTTSCHGSKMHITLVFCSFVLMQIFNQFNARKLYTGEINAFSGLMRPSAALFWFITVVTIAFQIMAVEVPGLNVLMRCVPLRWPHWVLCFVVAIVEWPLGYVVRLLPISEPPVEREADAEKLEALSAAPPAASPTTGAPLIAAPGVSRPGTAGSQRSSGAFVVDPAVARRESSARLLQEARASNPDLLLRRRSSILAARHATTPEHVPAGLTSR